MSGRRGFAVEEANLFWLAQEHYDREISLLFGHDPVRWIRHRLQESVLRGAFQKCQLESVLEVGCGTGRLFDIYRNVSGRRAGVDLNRKQLKHARKKAWKYQVQLGAMSAYDLGFDDQTFDSLVYSEVLLHIPPESIRKAISEACRVARRLIFLIDNYFEDRSDREIESLQNSAAPHCFVHKYRPLFLERNFFADVVRVPFSSNAIYIITRSLTT